MMVLDEILKDHKVMVNDPEGERHEHMYQISRYYIK